MDLPERSTKTLIFASLLANVVLIVTLLVVASAAKNYYTRALLAQHPVASAVQGATNPGVVFVGDSRVAQWAEHDAFDARYVSFSGASSHQIAAASGEISALSTDATSSMVIVQLGVNDLRILGPLPAQRDTVVRDSLAQLKQIVATLRANSDRVLVLDIFPTGTPGLLRSFVWSDEIEQARIAINHKLAATEWPQGVLFVETSPTLEALGDGAFTDPLHLTSAAYQALNALLSDYLGEAG